MAAKLAAFHAGFLGRGGDVGAAAARIFKGVDDIGDLARRLLQRQVLADVVFDVVQRTRHARRDLGDAHQHIAAQRALDRLADLVDRQGEGGVGTGRIGQVGLASACPAPDRPA